MSDLSTFLDSLSPEERKKSFQSLQSVGLAPASRDGIFTELGQSFLQGGVQAIRSLGKTFEHVGLPSGEDVVNWADKKLATNQQWNDYQGYSALSLRPSDIARTIGKGLGQSSVLIPSAIAGAVVGGVPGTALVGGTAFAQFYGDNVEEYKNKFKGKYSENEISAIAAGKSLVDATIETALGNIPIVGKLTKNLSSKVAKAAMNETVKKFGKSSTVKILKEVGKGALSEGSEEVLQYFNDAAFRSLMGDKTLDVKARDVLESFASGAWSGGAFGAVSGIQQSRTPDIDVNTLDNHVNMMNVEKHFLHNASNQKLNESLQRVTPGFEVNKDVEVVIPKTKASKMLQQLGKELGLDVNFFIPLNDNVKFNGALDENSNKVWINAGKSAADPRYTLGHEFFHFLEKENKQLAEIFYNLVSDKVLKTDAEAEFNELRELYSEEEVNVEFTADRLGELFIDGDFWQKFTQAEPSFTRALLDYINHFIDKVKKVFGKNPNAVKFIENLEEFKQKSIDEVLVPYISNLRDERVNAWHERFAENADKLRHRKDGRNLTSKSSIVESNRQVEMQHRADVQAKQQAIEDMRIKASREKNERDIANQQAEIKKRAYEKLVAEHAEKHKDVKTLDPKEVNKLAQMRKRYGDEYVDKLLNDDIDYSNLGHIDLLPSKKQAIQETNRPQIDWERFQDEYANLDKDKKKAVKEFLEKFDILPSKKHSLQKEIGSKIDWDRFVYDVAQAIKSSNDPYRFDLSPVDMSKVDIEKFKQETENVETPKAETEVKEEVAEEVTEPKAEAEEKAEAEPKVNLAKEPMKKVLAKLYTKGAKGKIIDKDLNFYETLRLLKFHGFDYTVKGAKVPKERRFVNPFNKKSVSYQKVQDIVKLFDDNGYVLLNVKDNSAPEVKDSGLSQKSANRVKYSKVRDKKLLQELENTKTIKLYRAVQIIDGKIYPPMAAKVNGKLIDPIELGKWEQSDVFYDGTKLKKNSKGIVQTDENGIPFFIFKLNKGNGSTIEADFAPYFHASDSPLNDQFTSAWNRPNLRIMEVEVPISEATSGYRAKHSPKTTGWHKWNTTSVSKQLGGPRDVFLSRYDKPIRLLSNKEVADTISEIVGKNVVIPENTVWDELRDLLIERGVKIGVPTDGQKRSKPVFDKDGNKIKYSRYRQVNPMISYLSPDQYKFHKDYLDKYKAPQKSNAQLKNDAAKKIADLGGIDKALKVALDGDLSTISDTNVYVYKTLLSCDEWKKLSKDEQTKLADQYHNALGSEAGRALAARRLGNFHWQDLESVISHINAFLAKAKNAEEITKRVKEETGIDLDKALVMQTDSTTSTPVQKTETETTSTDDGPGQTKPTKTEKTSEKVKPTEKGNEKGNTNPLQNPDDLNKVLTSMLSATKRMNDKSYEFWINAIQSGITSPIVNAIGNVTNIAYDLVAKRLVEATFNKAIFHRKDLATFVEFKQMAKAINWKQAFERAKFAWQHEALVKNSKLDRINVAIAGTKGKIIRTPTRILTIADEFAKSIIESVEATSEAFRHGNELGLKGKILQNYIAEQLKDEDSPANVYARERALELTFQSEVGTGLNHLMEIKNSDTVAGLVTRFFLPFIKGPANIIKKGARVTPLGTFNVAKDMFQIAIGKKDFDSKSLGLFAEQIIAWGSIMGLMSLMGDDDDYPIITGSQGALSATGRTFMRDKIPPYSIRIGGTYYSYKRLDPFATSLALIADGIANYQALKKGVKGEEVIKNLVGSVRSQFVDKSFFNAFNQLYQTLSTEGYAIKWGANFASSWMPNIVRQTTGYFDDNIRSSSNTAKGREWYENFFYMLVDKAGLLHGAPKIDYLGREVKKDSVEASAPLGIISRVLALNPQNPDENMGQVDRLLFNYAKENPENAYYPDVPSYFFRYKKKMVYFTGENYKEYAREAGELAHKQIKNAIKHGVISVDNPTEKDIRIIKGIFQRSRTQIKEKLIKEKKFTF